jgi:hypothetical protein
MCEMVEKLVNTPLFSFQILKLSTKNIIAALRDTLNITSEPLPILDPHAIGSIQHLGETLNWLTC